MRGVPRDEGGLFGMEIDLGGFPSFPVFAYMTRVGTGRGLVYLTFSIGGKWFKEPEIWGTDFE